MFEKGDSSFIQYFVLLYLLDMLWICGTMVLRDSECMVERSAELRVTEFLSNVGKPRTVLIPMVLTVSSFRRETIRGVLTAHVTQNVSWYWIYVQLGKIYSSSGIGGNQFNLQKLRVVFWPFFFFLTVWNVIVEKSILWSLIIPRYLAFLDQAISALLVWSKGKYVVFVQSNCTVFVSFTRIRHFFFQISRLTGKFVGIARWLLQ